MRSMRCHNLTFPAPPPGPALRSLRRLLPPVLALTAAAACAGSEPCDPQALALGRQVLAVQQILRQPGADGDLAAVVELGTDSRYYTMVRGWLGLQLQGDTSILDASEPGSRPAVEARVDFLRRAIRAIDLE